MWAKFEQAASKYLTKEYCHTRRFKLLRTKMKNPNSVNQYTYIIYQYILYLYILIKFASLYSYFRLLA